MSSFIRENKYVEIEKSKPPNLVCKGDEERLQNSGARPWHLVWNTMMARVIETRQKVSESVPNPSNYILQFL